MSREIRSFEQHRHKKHGREALRDFAFFASMTMLMLFLLSFDQPRTDGVATMYILVILFSGLCTLINFVSCVSHNFWLFWFLVQPKIQEMQKRCGK